MGKQVQHEFYLKWQGPSTRPEAKVMVHLESMQPSEGLMMLAGNLMIYGVLVKVC